MVLICANLEVTYKCLMSISAEPPAVMLSQGAMQQCLDSIIARTRGLDVARMDCIYQHMKQLINGFAGRTDRSELPGVSVLLSSRVCALQVSLCG